MGFMIKFWRSSLRTDGAGRPESAQYSEGGLCVAVAQISRHARQPFRHPVVVGFSSAAASTSIVILVQKVF